MAKKASKKSAKKKAPAKPAAKRQATARVRPAKPAKKAAPKSVPKPAAKKPAKPLAVPAARPVSARVRSRPAKPAPPEPAPVLEETSSGVELDAAVFPPAEPPLTPEEVEEFREILINKRRQILGDMGSLTNEALNKNRRDAAGDLSSMPIHMADLGSDNYEMEFTLGLIESERGVLREIDEALERIKNGTYGICLGTGRPIGKARLRAKPWAKYCYEYTLAQETGRAPRY